jgi:hypothetical protein
VSVFTCRAFWSRQPRAPPPSRARLTCLPSSATCTPAHAPQPSPSRPPQPWRTSRCVACPGD